MPVLLKSISALFLIYVLATSISCSQQDKAHPELYANTQQPLNPNGDSELALLMRAIYDEAALVKSQIANEESIAFTLDHKMMLTVEASIAIQAASPEYHAYTTAYLQAIKNLQAANLDERLELYDNMVNICLSCHQKFCPGPMGRIKKLQ